MVKEGNLTVEGETPAIIPSLGSSPEGVEIITRIRGGTDLIDVVDKVARSS
jgi:hypothetical protein